MLESFPVCLCIGTLLGFLSGLGVGGGSLLILWLTLIVGMPTGDARILNLLFFIPSALIASLFRRKQGVLDIKKLLPGVLAGCVCAGALTYAGKWLPTEFLKKLFGILLLVTGIRELFYRPRKAK